MTTTVLEEYRAHLLRRGMSARTVRNYVGVVEQLQRWAGVPVEDLDADHAAAFLHRPGLSQATRNGYHRWLTAYTAWSGAPLLEGVPRPRAPRPEPRPASRVQVDMMLEACRTDQETALVLLGCVAGLRAMEIARFRGEQLDPFERTVLVREGKGGKTARVPAPPALLAHARRMPSRGAWFPSRGRPGVPVTPWVVWRRMTDISHRAGAGHVPPHRLRAAYATEMVRSGVPLTTVQKCMRHSALATTAFYVAVGEDELHAAAASLPWAA